MVSGGSVALSSANACLGTNWHGNNECRIGLGLSPIAGHSRACHVYGLRTDTGTRLCPQRARNVRIRYADPVGAGLAALTSYRPVEFALLDNAHR